MRAVATLLALVLAGGPGLAAEATVEAWAGRRAALEARVEAITLGPFTLGAGLGWGQTGWVWLRAGLEHSLGPVGLLSAGAQGLAGSDLSLWGGGRVRATLGPLDASLRAHLGSRSLVEITGPLAGRPPGDDSEARAAAALRLDAAWRPDRRVVVEGAVEGQERGGVATLSAGLGVSLPNLVERGVTVGLAAAAGGPGGAWHALIRVVDRSGPAATLLTWGFGEQVRDPLTGTALTPRISPGFQLTHTLPLGAGPALPGAPGTLAEATLAWLPWSADKPILARLEVRATLPRGWRLQAAFEADAGSVAGRLAATLTF